MEEPEEDLTAELESDEMYEDVPEMLEPEEPDEALQAAALEPDEPNEGMTGTAAREKTPRLRSGSGRRKQPMRSEMDGLPPIKVVGVGGGGCNAVNRMITERVVGVQFVGVNTDAQALGRCEATSRIRIGDKITKGLGVGGDPSKGLRAAEESRDELVDALRGAEMVFITAGMGGGTGTGASPIVAEAAREMGALTIGVVTRPFEFEGAKRREQADVGIAELRERVDTLIAIPNQRLLEVCEQDVTVEDAFRMADDVLRQGIQGISEIITLPGEVNLDFADVRKVMSEAGPALLAIGRASGEDRASEAGRAAHTIPQLDISIDGARGVLFNVVGSRNLGLHELNDAAQVISKVVAPDAEIIFGTAIDPNMGDEVKVTVIATGFAGGLKPAVPAAEPTHEFQSEALPNPADVELPAFLRRTVAVR